jgi:hypothetical protein
MIGPPGLEGHRCGDKPPTFQRSLDASVAKPLSEERDGSGVWDAVNDTRARRLLEETPDIDQELELFIAKAEELLENQHIKEDRWISSHSPCLAIELLRITTSSNGRIDYPGIESVRLVITSIFSWRLAMR